MVSEAPMYMSPEQTRGRDVDKQTEHLGFRLASCSRCSPRERPFGGAATDTFSRILEHEPRLVPVASGSAPAAARKLLKRCLEKDLSRRVRDIGDARLELEDVQSLSGVLRRTSPGDERLQSRAWQGGTSLQSSLRRLVGAMAVTWLLQTRQPSPPNPLRKRSVQPCDKDSTAPTQRHDFAKNGR